MRIIEWNIRQGGGRRTAAIIHALLAQNPDVVVLTEFRNNDAGKKIRDSLATAGLANQLITSAAPSINSLLVASKPPLTRLDISMGDEENRYIAAECMGLNIFSLYFAQKERKRPLFDALLALPQQFLAAPSILAGDFNTGLQKVDEVGETFWCADAFQGLINIGWTDAWRHRHGTAKEYTWYSNSGNGFRIDHLFASPSALASLTSLAYSHGERRPDLSDHSMLIAEYLATQDGRE